MTQPSHCLELRDRAIPSVDPVMRRGVRGRSSGYLLERIEAEYKAKIADLEFKVSLFA